jgi:putative ABC transport system permease protein
MSDLVYAFRALRSGRMFTIVAVVCLALGIATNTTMFSVFDAMFLRPLPFKDADRLVSLAGRHPETGRRVPLTPNDMRDLSAMASSVEAMAAYSGRSATLTDGGEPERIATQLVTSNLFPMLGAHAQHGRSFEPGDDAAAGASVAIIGDGLWHRRYQANSAVLGRVIRLDNVPYTVVGVMPPGFRFPSSSELWIPMAPALGPPGLNTRSVSILVKLKPDVTLARANAELGSKILPASGSSRPPRSAVARQFGRNVGGEERTIAGALMGATSVLLLIACANVANLLLARGAGRRREIAVRAALGASRGRIVRQLLTESVLLAMVSAAVALPLAWIGIGRVRDAVPPSDALPYYMAWTMDVRTFVYAAAIALLTGLLFGLAPAFDAAGKRLLDPLREGTAGSGTGRLQRRVHNALIVAQIALALVLLAGASIFVRTFVGLNSVELGYDMSHLMTMRVYFAGSAYDQVGARVRAVDQIAEKLRALPGAHAATVSDLVPLDDQGGSDSPALVEGRVFEEGKEPTVQYAGVAGKWLETFDLRLAAGRSFEDHELTSDAPVALVNRALAATFWPGENALGRRFKLADAESGPWLTVIGVVPDIRTVKLDENVRTPPPTAYLPHRFISTRNYGIVVRARAEPASVTASVRDAVHAVDPSLALFDIWSMDDVHWLSFWMFGMWGTLFGLFGALALLLAAVGVYGVTFYTVAQRTREIGLCVALGAGRAQVVRPMLRRALLLALAGIAIGVGGALLVTPIVGSLLIGVSPTDPASFAGVSLALAAVALAATWLPAWRASNVDPMIALRRE